MALESRGPAGHLKRLWGGQLTGATRTPALCSRRGRETRPSPRPQVCGDRLGTLAAPGRPQVSGQGSGQREVPGSPDSPSGLEGDTPSGPGEGQCHADGSWLGPCARTAHEARGQVPRAQALRAPRSAGHRSPTAKPRPWDRLRGPLAERWDCAPWSSLGLPFRTQPQGTRATPQQDGAHPTRISGFPEALRGSPGSHVRSTQASLPAHLTCSCSAGRRAGRRLRRPC